MLTATFRLAVKSKIGPILLLLFHLRWRDVKEQRGSPRIRSVEDGAVDEDTEREAPRLLDEQTLALEALRPLEDHRVGAALEAEVGAVAVERAAPGRASHGVEDERISLLAEAAAA